MTAPPNPLIAPRVDSTTWYSGVGLIESIDVLIAGIKSDSWVDTTLGAIGTVAETAAWVLDPVGMLVAAGFGAFVEHVKPLSDALDWLAGDPDQVTAHAQTWVNAAAAQKAIADDYAAAASSQLPHWTGLAANAYQRNSQDTVDLVTALGRACEAMATLVSGAGALVAMVRTLVRDLIAQAISTLLVRLPMWTAETVLSFGVLAPYVGAQVTALVAKFGAQIARLLRGLVNSLRNLGPISRNLDEIIETIKDLLRRRRAAEPEPPRPGGDDAARGIDEPPAFDPASVGPLRPPARELLENEGVLIGPEKGLQSRLNGTFDNVVHGEHGDPTTKYLWTIDNRGINAALEATPFDTPRGNIVHTNLSSEASIGGEVWFGPNNTVTINAGSGRFGDAAGITREQWDAAIEAWTSLGYTVNAIPYGSR